MTVMKGKGRNNHPSGAEHMFGMQKLLGSGPDVNDICLAGGLKDHCQSESIMLAQMNQWSNTVPGSFPSPKAWA